MRTGLQAIQQAGATPALMVHWPKQLLTRTRDRASNIVNAAMVLILPEDPSTGPALLAMGYQRPTRLHPGGAAYKRIPTLTLEMLLSARSAI